MCRKPSLADRALLPAVTARSASGGESNFPAAERLRLVGDGHVHIKLSAIYRLCPPPYDRAAPFIAALVAANPSACLWGSDWPHLMLNGAQMPDAATLLDAFHGVVTSDKDRITILKDTPNRLFFG